MSKGIYIGVDDVSNKIKNAYIGVGGSARKIKKAYIGVDGVAKLFYESSSWQIPRYTGSHAVFGDTDQGYMELYTSGSLFFDYPNIVDIFAVGDGSSGMQGESYSSSETRGGAGGAGGSSATLMATNLAANTYTVEIGSSSVVHVVSFVEDITIIDSGYSGGATGGIAGQVMKKGTVSARNAGNGSAGTPKFGEPGAALYGGGGGGGGASLYSSGKATIASAGTGTNGGGGGGAATASSAAAGAAGTANTGGGGGGGASYYRSSSDRASASGGSGGTGIIIIRWGY